MPCQSPEGIYIQCVADFVNRVTFHGRATATRHFPKRVAETEKDARHLGVKLRQGICKKFGWQAHTTRALMSAGGSLTKKHGITVISEKGGDSRTYRIAK